MVTSSKDKKSSDSNKSSGLIKFEEKKISMTPFLLPSPTVNKVNKIDQNYTEEKTNTSSSGMTSTEQESLPEQINLELSIGLPSQTQISFI